MTLHDCEGFQRVIATALSLGEELPAWSLNDARSCTSCAELLRSLRKATREDVVLAAPRPEAEARSVTLASTAARRTFMAIGIARACLGLVAGLAWIVLVEWKIGTYLLGQGSIHLRTLEVVRASIVTLVVVWLGLIATFDRRRGSRPPRLHTRWNGRQLQGICVGLSEYLGGPAWMWRLGFLTLFFSGLGGGSIYLILSFVISFHPDDRRHLLWFRICRLFSRLRGKPSAT